MSRIRFSSLLAVFAVTTGVAFGQAVSAAPEAPQKTISAEVKAEVLAGVSRVINRSAFVPGHDLSKWDEFIAAEKDSIDKAATDAEFAAAVRQAMNKFGVSHMVLITPQAAKARIERKAVGIGISIQPQEDGLLVTTVYDGSPAADAKLEPGDVIFEADGKKLTAGSTITGDEGTQVEIKVRKSDGKVVTLKLTRRKFSNVRPDTLTWKNAETAVIKVHTFDLSYDRKRIDELMNQAKKAKQVIVDLRSNGGGAVLNMIHFIGHFVAPSEKFGIFIGRGMVKDYVEKTGGDPNDLRKIAQQASMGWLRPTSSTPTPFSGNVAVLINGGSGSASEITAQAFKELRGAPVVGTKSAGAVLVSTMAPVSNNWMLQYPLSDYLSVRGVRLEGNGIVPDVEAPTPRFGETDEGVEKAISLLKRIELRESRNP